MTFMVNGKPFDASAFAGDDPETVRKAHQNYRERRGIQVSDSGVQGSDSRGGVSPRMLKHRPSYGGVQVK